ncbi:putative head maturation protease [Acinetobacter phage BS46]|nr:putative head maturation protease [Acinetobacter phage BS46]
MAKYKRGSLALARQVFNTPQLIIESDLQRISQFLVDRANGVELFTSNKDVDKNTEITAEVLQSLASYDNEEDRKSYQKAIGITNDGKRGNLFVEGTLVAKAGEIDADCMELTSYEKLFSTFQMQVKEGIQELLITVDSGGGAAFSCFEMAQEVKSLAVKNNIKIYTYIDGLAASAAYAWASIADEVIARPQSEVGSIGVVVQLINNNKMLENIGITRKFITYGESKVPFGDDGEFTKNFLESLQKKVNKTGLEFTSFVSKNRNMSTDEIISTQAEVFDAEEALSIGLIDKIMTKSEFFNDYLPSRQTYSSNQTYLQTEEHMKQEQNKAPVVATVEELQAQLSASEATKEQLTTEIESLKEQLSVANEFQEKLATLQASYDALVVEKEASEKAAQVAKRQASLEAAIGKDNEQLASLLESTAMLEDSAFEIVVKGLSTQQESKQAKLEEKGGEGAPTTAQLSIEEKLAATAKRMTKQPA